MEARPLSCGRPRCQQKVHTLRAYPSDQIHVSCLNAIFNKMATNQAEQLKNLAPVESNLFTLLSIDEAQPSEEGGPIARTGFNYQDEIAVGFLIEMLEDPSALKVHCETHDDIVVVRTLSASTEITAEYVQVKAGEPDKLWSLSDICQRKKGKPGKPAKPGTSIYETSLERDRHKESSQFRIVTLLPVVNALKILSFPLGTPDRDPGTNAFKTLHADLEMKIGGAKSLKNNGGKFWLENCYWDERDSEEAVRNDNLIRILKLAAKENQPILTEPAEIILNDLRARAKAAGAAKWKPDRAKKIIIRTELRLWWEKKVIELREGASSASGGKLAGKMHEASLPEDMVKLAIDLRRDYSSSSRTSRYDESGNEERLRARVKSTVQSLRSALVSGELNLNGSGFHHLCLKEMDKINAEREEGTADQSAFLKGCMYDIADRCLLRFERPS
jgi:hypothetical protein